MATIITLNKDLSLQDLSRMARLFGVVVSTNMQGVNVSVGNMTGTVIKKGTMSAEKRLMHSERMKEIWKLRKDSAKTIVGKGKKK